MSKYQWISILGVWVMVFLFLGFRSWLEKAIAVITGLIIIAIAYRIGAEARIAHVDDSASASASATPTGDSTAGHTSSNQ